MTPTNLPFCAACDTALTRKSEQKNAIRGIVHLGGLCPNEACAKFDSWQSYDQRDMTEDEIADADARLGEWVGLDYDMWVAGRNDDEDNTARRQRYEGYK